MKLHILAVALATTLLSFGSNAVAQVGFDIACEGTESTGGGLNRYQYTLRNVSGGPNTLVTFCFGTEDGNVADYQNVVMPAGWTLVVIPNGSGPCAAGFTTGVKTPHGAVPPAGGPASTFQVVFAGPPVPVPPNGTVTFGFHNYKCSWDVEWFALGTPFSGQGFPAPTPIAGPVGVYTNGWIHGPGPVPPPPLAFCDASDGSLTFCPCMNPGLPNTGCDNAQATGGVGLTVQAWSPDCMGGGTAALVGTGYPPASNPGVVAIRATSLDAFSPVPFGDGLRCVATPIVRVGATLAAGGTSVVSYTHGAMAGAGPFFYQLWYRNTPASYCNPNAAYNLSNGQMLVW